MHARTGLLKISPDRIDDAVRAFNDEQLPRYKEQSGYKGFTLLADRQRAPKNCTLVHSGRDLSPL